MKIQIGKEKLHANIPWRVTNNTTTNLGFVQPFMMLHTIANGDYKIKMQSQVRLSPLVAPTFAHMYLKTYARAIQITDIWQPFSNLYSGKPYKYSDSSELRYVTKTPDSALLLIFFNLIGAYDNFSYCPYDNVAFDVNGRVTQSTKYNEASSSRVRDNFVHMVDKVHEWNNTYPSDLAPYDNDLLRALFSGYNWHTNHIEDGKEFFNYDREFGEHINISESFEAEGADFILCLRDRWVQRHGNESYTSGFGGLYAEASDQNIEHFFYANKCIGIRLGEFGKKLRQIFRGLGIPIDDMLNPLAICRYVEDNKRTDVNIYMKPFNVLPIVAYAKCIYDQFGIRKFVDYSSTHIYNLVNEINNVYKPLNHFSYLLDDDIDILVSQDNVNLDSQQPDTNSYSAGFIASVLYELMQTSWYTLDVDLFSSINKTVGLQNNSINVDLNVVTNDNNYKSDFSASTSQVYNDESVYPVTVNLANKLLHWVNTENVIGASIAKWFKEKYGISLDTDQTKYTSLIGHNSTDINIGPIFSQSDTVNESDTSGQTLGAFAGHGEARENVKTLSTYHSKDFGFIFTFGCVCPEVGYFQSLEPIYEKSTRFDYFTPEWDSMGFVPVSHNIINAGFLNRVCGVLPRYFIDKFKFSVVNGDMNLGSTRNNMEAYWFNREVSSQFSNKEGLLLSDDFRRIGKKETLGFYNKIFTETSPFVDHYLIDCLFDIKASLPCKPIAESWDTVDEQDGQGKTITSKS